jgi:hypothetical protein
MRNFRLVVLGSAAAVSLAGIGIAAAGNVSSESTSRAVARAQILTQLRTLEVRAAANPQAYAALQRVEVALVAQPADASSAHGRPTSPPPPCPSHAPNAGGIQPCGVVAHLICPSHSPNAGNHPPCGKPTPPPACGPADTGGTAATGLLSGPLYSIGEQISAAGGAPLGDAIQTIACAIFTNLPPL